MDTLIYATCLAVGVLFTIISAVAGHFFGGTDGQNPSAELIASDHSLFGTTAGGGSSGAGVVFRMNLDGTGYEVLKHFTGADGQQPVAALVLGGTTLYGTTYLGGSSGYGTVFKLNTDGSAYTVLKHFSSFDYPRGALVLAGATLYGTTQSGGLLNYGSVFRISTSGSDFTQLGSFLSDAFEGVVPRAGLVLWGNTLYGTASGGA